MLVALISLAFAQNSFTEEPRKFQCDGTIRNYEHTFVVEIEKDEILVINYASMTTDGYTCEIIARRNDDQSKWTKHDKGIEIVTSPLGLEAGTVYIETQGSNYKLTVRSGMAESCGIKGYLAPVAILKLGQPDCDLINEK